MEKTGRYYNGQSKNLLAETLWNLKGLPIKKELLL